MGFSYHLSNAVSWLVIFWTNVNRDLSSTVFYFRNIFLKFRFFCKKEMLITNCPPTLLWQPCPCPRSAGCRRTSRRPCYRPSASGQQPPAAGTLADIVGQMPQLSGWATVKSCSSDGLQWPTSCFHLTSQKIAGFPSSWRSGRRLPCPVHWLPVGWIFILFKTRSKEDVKKRVGNKSIWFRI